MEPVKSGTPQQIQVAIDKGAEVKTQAKNGGIALMFAAGYDQDPDVITTLLRNGAYMNARDHNGVSALLYAAVGNRNPP